jgi:hypothetical protein
MSGFLVSLNLKHPKVVSPGARSFKCPGRGAMPLLGSMAFRDYAHGKI